MEGTVSRLATFNINVNPVDNSIIGRKLQEKENELRKYLSSFYNEVEIVNFIKIMKDSGKSSKTLIDDELQSYAWSDELYLKIYDAIMLQCHFNCVGLILQIKMKKFGEDNIPINYLTSIIRSSIDKKKKLFAIIEDDLNSIRKFFKEHCGDKGKISSHLPPRFIELNIKVNRNQNLDSETKKLLNKEINDCHKKVQEWIRKN